MELCLAEIISSSLTLPGDFFGGTKYPDVGIPCTRRIFMLRVRTDWIQVGFLKQGSSGRIHYRFNPGNTRYAAGMFSS